MPYATQADMLERFGEQELVQLTDRHDGQLNVVDAVVLDKALATAEAEIDAYVGMRHALPLASVSARLVGLACDIARYHLYIHAAPDIVAERYQEALKFLRAVAAGEVSLGLEEAAAPLGLVEYVTSPRLFSRGNR